MSGEGLYLWLCPKRQAEPFTTLQNFINTGSVHKWEPHVTLLSPRKGTTLQTFVQKLKCLPLTKPFSLTFSHVEKGNTNYRSVYLRANPSKELNVLRESVVGLFGTDEAEFMPHLSLHYGEDEAERERAFAAANTAFSTSLPSLSFNVDAVELVQCSGPPHSWRVVGRFLLTHGVFLHSQNFINGSWESSPATSLKLLPVVNPATREVFHYVPASTVDDVNKAVDCAVKAFRSWATTPPSQRAVYLQKMAQYIEDHKSEFAHKEVLDNGKPLAEATADIDDAIGAFRFYAEQAIKLEHNQQSIVVPDKRFDSKVEYEPVGVAALIVPWNYPLLMATWKVAPCLAAGCTAVLKPSEYTPITALELANAAMAAGLPAGVLNIVTGYGYDCGNALAVHPDVQKVSFTGSVPTGSKIMHAAADGIKRQTLELGGKSPMIILEDADIEKTVEWMLLGIFFNCGQICSATSRILVHESIAGQVVNRLLERTKKIKVGNGLDSDVKMGPVICEQQFNKVISYIKAGFSGSKSNPNPPTLLCGGKHYSFLPGFFIEPTIFKDVSEDHVLWKEEIFGPVLCINTFKNEEDAIRAANDTSYGLAAAVMGKDAERCKKISDQLRAGVVWLNCNQLAFVQAPWGGMKKSGCGREGGPWGLHNFLEVKQVTTIAPTAEWSWFA